jgi:hypothetical protein
MERPRGGSGFEMMQQFTRARPQPPPGESCDLCGVPVADEHGHVVDLQNRGMLCACRACYLLFFGEGSARGKYRSVPDRHLALSPALLNRRRWNAWQIPVDMAFIFVNSSLDRPVVFYPSPAGAVESALPLDALDSMLAEDAALATLEPDVEALLARSNAEGFECFIVPIDRCYQLVGELRLLWRGFDGGEDVHRRIDEFFESVRSQSRSPEQAL